MKKDSIYAYAVIVFVVAVWGVSFVSAKVVLGAFSPVAVALFRLLIASVILITAKLISNKEKLEKKDILRMAVSGISGLTIYFICENNGVMYVSANSASILSATLPFATMICDRIFYKTRITRLNVISIAASIFGVYLVIGKDIMGGGNAVGYLFLVGSIVSWCIYLITTKPLFKKYSDITVTMYQCIFGILGFIPFIPMISIDVTSINFSVIFHLLFLSVFCSAIGNWGYNYAYKRLDMTVSATFLNLSPVATFLFSFIILGETLTIRQIIGAAIILTSLILVSRYNKNDVSISGSDDSMHEEDDGKI